MEAPVVVGVDGSEASRAAIGWAAAEAAARGTTLRVVHAFVWPMFRVPLGPSEVAPGLRAAADLLVGEAVELAAKLEPDVPVETAVVTGFPFPVLTEESLHAGVVVVGSRGLGATLSVLIGSTAVDLVAHAHCPVVVIRTQPEPTDRPGGRVVVGFDGSVPARAALDFGLEHAARHGLELLIATVHEERSHEPASALAPDGAGSMHDDVPVSSVMLSGHPAEELLRLSADARMIVIGSRGRGGFGRLLLGSVSEAVLQHAACPVAVIGARTR